MILRWKARGTLLQDAKAKAVSDCVEGKCKGCGGEHVSSAVKILRYGDVQSFLGLKNG